MAGGGEEATTTRRSKRERKQTTSLYDSALTQAANSAQTKKKKKIDGHNHDSDASDDVDDQEQEQEESFEEQGDKKDSNVDMDVDEGQEDDEEDEEEASLEEDEEIFDDVDSDEESYSPKKGAEGSSSARKNKKKSTVTTTKKKTAPNNNSIGPSKKAQSRITTAKTSKTMKSPGRPAGKKRSNAGASIGGRQRAVTALNALAKKIIKDPQKETPTNSVLAALLKVHNVKKGGSIVSGIIDPSEPRKPPRCLETSNINPPAVMAAAAAAARAAGAATAANSSSNMHLVYSKVVAVGSEITPYSQHIEGLAKYLIRTVTDSGLGSNSLHLSLMNLIFRCVGGTVQTNIPADTDLDELSDDDYDTILTNVVQAMTDTADEILIYSKLPTTNATVTISNGTGQNATLVTKTIPTPKIGPATFRDIYKEFWYRLGTTILNYTPQNAFVADDDDDYDSDDENVGGDNFSFGNKGTKKNKKSSLSRGKQHEFSSNRFQLEMARDLVQRLADLSTVTQPDIRMASTFAIFQLSQACIERTVELEMKIQTSKRQYKAASQQKSSSKMETIKNQMDIWKRHKAELEDLVENDVFKGVFTKRYRDSNASIREESIKALQKVCLVRPDMFLVDAWLKYLGWMASDLEPNVRLAALEGLLAPFIVHEAQASEAGATSLPSSSKTAPFPVDITSMGSVTKKFLTRITDSLLDIAKEVPIQETAIKLLNNMMMVGFLDDWEDDAGWDQINLKAIDIDASPLVRKDALYFVLDQIDAFDQDAPASGHTEQKQEEQLQGIAEWIAAALVDGSVPIDSINIHLADLVVQSLLEMPEHSHLVRNWHMMLKAIQNLYVLPEEGNREAIAKQRVLLRFLIAAAELDSNSGTTDNKAGRIQSGKRKRTSKEVDDSRDSLSVALLKDLPSLISNFKGDPLGLRDVTQLPLTIPVSVFTLVSRKKDLQNVMKSLCQLFLDSTDEKVLVNIAAVFSYWSEGDHARMPDIKAQLLRMSGVLQDRLMDLFRESEQDGIKASATPSKGRGKRKSRTPRTGESSLESASTTKDMFAPSPEVETEHALSLSLQRWKILLTACPPDIFFESIKSADDDEDDDKKEDDLVVFFKTISEGAGKRLKERMPFRDTLDDETTVGGESKSVMTIPVIWKSVDGTIHEEVAKTVKESLQVCLVMIAWKVEQILRQRSGDDLDDMDVDSEDIKTSILDMRKRLITLLGACFDQLLPSVEESENTEDQQIFASSVMTAASKVSSDLRSLFPDFWAHAEDEVISSLALTNQSGELSMIVAGNGRYFQEREKEEREDEEEDEAFVDETMLPVCRSVSCNQTGYYRKETALVLSHISNSGKPATEAALALTRFLKKTDPTRLLETQMLCLRCSFDTWVDNEPEELDHPPSEVEEEAMREKEKYHEELYSSMEHLASKLSSTLGVGKLTDKRLKKGIGSFFKEGIRWAFSTAGEKGEEEYFLGSRLPFLTIVGKYGAWLKKEKSTLQEIKEHFFEHLHGLREHSDFEEVQPDDLHHLREFANLLGISEQELLLPLDDETTLETYDRSKASTTPSPNNSSRHSRPSTAGSTRSRMSTLSPVDEDASDGDIVDDDEEGESIGNSPTKRSRRQHSSVGSLAASEGSPSATSRSTRRSRGTLEEVDEESMES